MESKTRRTVLRRTAVGIVAAVGGCLGSGGSEAGRTATDTGGPPGATATSASTTSTPTSAGTPTATPTRTPVPPWALDSSVTVRFGEESPNLPGNGIEVVVDEVGTPDAVKAYVGDDEGDTRWIRFPEGDARYSIYRNEYGRMIESVTADAGIETGGDSMMADGVGWPEGTSPERTVELYGDFDGEEVLLDRERGTV